MSPTSHLHMPKYTGLPDIDTETPEILEYGPPDEPINEIGIETRNGNEDDESLKEHVDTAGLKYDSKIYETSEIDASKSDFSGSLNAKYSNGFHVSKVNETIEARIARLRLEIEQLDSIEVTEATELRQLLEKKITKDDIRSEDLYTDLQISNTEISPSSDVEKSKPYDQSEPYDQSRFASLENRISKLETRLGMSLASTSNDETTPLSLKLEDMKRRIALLTASPQGLDKSVVKLKDLILTINELRTAGPTMIDNAVNSDAKINSIYSKLDSIEQISKVLPDVVMRLNSLRQLHADAAYSESTLTKAESTLDEIRADFRQWQTSIESLENKLMEQAKKNEKNREILQNYMKEKMTEKVT